MIKVLTAEEFVNDLRNNIYCRMRPSGTHGVGVFAVRDIPAGINPFFGVPDWGWLDIPREKIMDDPAIPQGVKDMVVAYFEEEDGVFQVPPHTMNLINITYFLNHSDTPNMEVHEENDTITFITSRLIKEGEELTGSYGLEPGAR